LTKRCDSPQGHSSSPLSVALGFFAACFSFLTPSITETAIANGDTRTIYLHHAHTGEDIAATYLVNGQYDSRVLEQLNWFLRDWRRDEPTNMDPRLFDVVWEAYRSAGAGNQVINVVSAYRSPETNAMLRARSRAVAKYSQHMLGKAMDTTMPGMPMSQVREIGMRMQRGGVGYYPNANTPFVHLDVGNVRAWPRMSYEQLVRLFPDGKTVHLPTNGQPLPGYEEARAEIEARGNGAYVTAPRRTFGGFFASLFGMGGGEDEDAEIAAPAPSTRKQWSALAPRNSRAVADEGGEEGGEAPATNRRGRNQIARAETDLPRGETVMTATGAVDVAAPTNRAPQTAASPAATDEAPATAGAQEEQKPTRAVHVPLPPARPTSLDVGQRTETARLESQNAGDLRMGLDESESSGQDAPAASDRRVVNAPTPPRRPARLASLAADDRSAAGRAIGEANAPRAIADLVDAVPEKQDADPALAYAPHAGDDSRGAEAYADDRTAPKTEFVPARLDRSNFNALTGATPAARASARSVIGAPLAPVRSAARASESSVLLPPTRPTHLVGFAASETPPTDRFAPSASRAKSPAPKSDANAKKQ
jgi:uncharacterized protein YcbK (DUF882 family)